MDKYADTIAAISVQIQNYDGENWDEALVLCAKADQRIAELEAELEKHRWIPVEERLPEEKDLTVLVYADDRFHLGNGFEHPRLGHVVSCRGAFFDSFGNCVQDFGLSPITHWKPITLPERK